MSPPPAEGEPAGTPPPPEGEPAGTPPPEEGVPGGTPPPEGEPARSCYEASTEAGVEDTSLFIKEVDKMAEACKAFQNKKEQF